MNCQVISLSANSALDIGVLFDGFDLRIKQLQGVGHRRDAAACDRTRRGTTSSNFRGDKHMNFVDSMGVEEAPQHFAATFDQQVRTLPTTKFG